VHLAFGSAGEADGASAIVTLHHAERRPFQVTGIEVSHPELLEATLVAGGKPAAQQMIRIGLQGTVDDLHDAADLNGRVSVSTGDAQHPSVDIPVVVSRVQRSGQRPVRSMAPRP
jgi:hypothetical protein